MVSPVKAALVVASSLFLLAAPARSANNAEQVVFSTPGFLMNLQGNTKAGSTPFGFWIWCAAEAAPGSKGGYENAHACQGSMYFYALDTHATPIVGFNVEGPDGIYTMFVQQGTFAQLKAANFGPIPGTPYSCTLQNDTPDPHGPGNSVTVHCRFSSELGGGSGAADVTNAVVNVTGP